MTTYVDSSAFYAAADEDDVSHPRTVELLRGAGPLLTSDHVLVETWLLLNRRLGRPAAERFLHGSVGGGLEVEYVVRADIDQAIEIGKNFKDQSFSLADRTSFSIMQRRGIDRVITLDDDFAVYRFGSRRQHAFEVLR